MNSRSRSDFELPFGRLVELLRLEPANQSGQKDALRAAVAALRFGPVDLEAGVEYSDLADESSLRMRMLRRKVDTIRLEADAPAAEVLSLARALADDVVPVVDGGSVQVIMVPLPDPPPAPGPRESLLAPEPPVHPAEPASRSRTMAGPEAEVQELSAAFSQACEQAYWVEALHAAQALVAMTSRYPEHERRGYQLSLRQLFTRDILVHLVHHALRNDEDKYRVVEVLRAAGPLGCEVAAEQIAGTQSVGPRAFLYEFLATSPDSLRLLLGLLQRDHPPTIAHAAELLGRLGHPEGVAPLRELVHHPDPGVRRAAVLALGRFEDNRVIEPIRQALSDASPETRVTAAQTLAHRRSAGLAMPLIASLETEKDPAAWRELAMILGSMDSGDAVGALVTVALSKRTLFRGGKSTAQRLAAVEALAASRHERARRGLERIAELGEGQVREAARRALGGGN